MTAVPGTPLPTRPRGGLVHQLRVLFVVAGSEFKLKYAGSALGYVWSVLKPLALFTMLYLVFGRVFDLSEISRYYPLSLLIGIVLFFFYADATTLGMSSIVARESLLRRLAFPRVIIPASATITALLTLCANLTVIAAFVAWNRITPRLEWLLLLPLLAELYIFVLGVSLILAVVFVRLRDIGQVWELLLQLTFYATPIIYPIGYLPSELRTVAFLNPFTQVLQDARALILYAELPANRITVTDALGAGGRLIPVAIAVAVLALGLVLMKRESPWFAERI